MDSSYIKRLVFIKYLHKIGEEQSKLPEPLSSISILTFHNAIELFLQLTVEYLNCGQYYIEFMEYWDIISKKLGKELAYKDSMRRLNKARVAFKHHGNLPSNFNIEEFRIATQNFFIESCQLIFTIDFEDVTLIDLVPSEEIQELLKTANNKIHTDKYEALKNISISFAKVLTEYEAKLYPKYGNINNEFSKDYHSYHYYYSSIDATPFQKIENKLDAIADSILILSLGLNYNKYLKFKTISFYVFRTTGGGYHVTPQKEMEDSIDGSINDKYSIDDIKFCLDFVIETSIVIYSIDFNFSSTHLA